MKTPLGRFLLRWLLNGVGIWIAATVLGADTISYQSKLGVIIIAGLILAIINAIIKPIIVLLSLPALLFSLGLFMIVINGLMLLLVSWLYAPLQVTNFGAAILAGMIIGLVNYLVAAMLEEK